MEQKEWEESEDAQSMLLHIWREHPFYLRTQVRPLHHFLIDCCWKYQHLIPQSGLRNGLRGAEKWLAGEIGDEALNRLNYYAEADAFAIDYARSPEQIQKLRNLVASIPEIQDLPFEEARALLLKAAYFAEGSMFPPRLDQLAYRERLFTSEFLCPHLLRKHLKPPFDSWSWQMRLKWSFWGILAILLIVIATNPIW